MKIEIDAYAGFCPGVNRTVSIADKVLKSGGSLYSMGELLHNQPELDRLKSLGLTEMDKNRFDEFKNKNVMIRTHGEPPETYILAEKNDINLTDGTCRIVKKLQLLVQELSQKAILNQGQVLIFGNSMHPEVIGLMGYSENKAITIETDTDIEKIDFSRPAYLISQTTQDHYRLLKLNHILEQRYNESGRSEWYHFYNTICKFVLSRVERLKDFSARHDIVIFIGGSKSSNSRFLYSVCKSVNQKSYLVSDSTEIHPEWIRDIHSIGITGATSTPLWQLKSVAEFIESYKYVSPKA